MPNAKPACRSLDAGSCLPPGLPANGLAHVRRKRTIVRIMRTKKKQAVDWLFPQVRKRVLSLLLMGPDERWHLREIARRTRCAPGTVRRELEGLAAAGIARRVKDGNRTYYQADPACGLLEELTGLIRKTAGLADVVRSALGALGGKIELAFIYGSQARGDPTSGSDVGLLVVGDVDELELHRAVAKAETELPPVLRSECQGALTPILQFGGQAGPQLVPLSGRRAELPPVLRSECQAALTPILQFGHGAGPQPARARSHLLPTLEQPVAGRAQEGATVDRGGGRVRPVFYARHYGFKTDGGVSRQRRVLRAKAGEDPSLHRMIQRLSRQLTRKV